MTQQLIAHSAAGPAVARHIIGFDLRRRPQLESDVLVVGSGVAGFCAALRAAEAGCEVLLLTKGSLPQSNSSWAQGGVAAVMADGQQQPGDSIDLHLRDTLQAGGGLVDEVAARSMLAEGGELIEQLIAQGCQFDLGSGGDIALTREGGHSTQRILHASGDATGREMVRALIAQVQAQPQITIVEQAFTIDLLSHDQRVVGAIYQRRGEIYAAIAGATILTTGGCGRVYRETTNPKLATGDGLAMAYRAGAVVADCEFMQFHPTTLYIAGRARLLITEAMRGEGALLKNHRGDPFMNNYHTLGDLAPRDIVSQAIMSELRRDGSAHVWLDASHLGSDFLRERFPTIYQACADLHIDIGHDWMPVHPSAHYHCGGVVTDLNGATSLAGCFAAGEVAATGLHGANRLASNSLLEALVMGRRAGAAAAACGGQVGRMRLASEHLPPAVDIDVEDLTRTLRATCWRLVGIERNQEGLEQAQRSLDFWSKHQAAGYFGDTAGWQLQNLLLVGRLIAHAALGRPASLGTHARQDSAGPSDGLRHAYRHMP